MSSLAAADRSPTMASRDNIRYASVSTVLEIWRQNTWNTPDRKRTARV